MTPAIHVSFSGADTCLSRREGSFHLVKQPFRALDMLPRDSQLSLQSNFLVLVPRRGHFGLEIGRLLLKFLPNFSHVVGLDLLHLALCKTIIVLSQFFRQFFQAHPRTLVAFSHSLVCFDDSFVMHRIDRGTDIVTSTRRPGAEFFIIQRQQPFHLGNGGVTFDVVGPRSLDQLAHRTVSVGGIVQE